MYCASSVRQYFLQRFENKINQPSQIRLLPLSHLRKFNQNKPPTSDRPNCHQRQRKLSRGPPPLLVVGGRGRTGAVAAPPLADDVRGTRATPDLGHLLMTFCLAADKNRPSRLQIQSFGIQSTPSWPPTPPVIS
ncbi:hypothetical protein GWI33_022784 [Rhynchophorus ferrugineus]|uniref:Uncharacterized protein n=1 Tax=Rhynchophorus ferrugineus TaxID=354439 RepID=A0A834MHC8_RHYFE|nr:hypothetical protein GWI33_022784 [Rhynchophorus ferrugineus]